MIERPILFSGPMVQAVLRDQDPKTKTRRVISSEYPMRLKGDFIQYRSPANGRWYDWLHTEYSPYGQPSDTMWVREAWAVCDHDFAMKDGKEEPTAWLINYPADNSHNWVNPPEDMRASLAAKWGTACTTGGPDSRVHPSIHMYKWISRIMLEITGVRVERLQTISNADICAEMGIPAKWPGPGSEPYPRNLRQAFIEVWDSLNAKRGHPWASNPWVWVISFKRL